MKIFLTSLALFACVHPAFGQGSSPRFVRLGDLNTSQVTTEPTSGGAVLLENGELIFSGSDSEAGEEIWIKSFYSNEARRVVDFRPGGESSSPRNFAPLDGHRFSVVVDDGITGPEVVVLDSDGDFFPNQSGKDLCPGRDHAAPRLLGRVGDAALYVLDDGADVFGRPGESVWMFSSSDYPVWLETFKPGSVRQPRNGTPDQLYFVGQRWDEAEIALFRVNGAQSNHAELLCVMGDPAVAEPLPDQVYAVTPGMVCYRGFNGSQPMIRAFRTDAPGNLLSYPLWPVTDPSFASNGYDRICYASYDPVTGIEPWMIVDDFMGSALAPQLVVDSNPSTTLVTASRFTMEGNILYFETGWNSRVLKFVDTSLTNRVAYTIFSNSELITRRLPVSWNQLAYVVTTGGSDSLFLYTTTTRTSQSLSQNVQVRDLWAPANGLNAIFEDSGNDMLYSLQGTSWLTVDSFTTGSARRLPVTTWEGSNAIGWVIGSEWDLVPRLYRYPVALSGWARPVTMFCQGPSINASSHPADFHDLNGHLFLTATKDRQRLLFHSPDGAQDSLQPVPLASSGADFPIGELVRLGNQLFLRSAVDGTLGRALVEPAPVDAVIRPVLDGATPIPAERLTVAAGKVFFVQVGATTETLRFVNPDLSLGTVQVFQKPATGQAIALMTGTPDRLFFKASINPNDSSSPAALWSTTGSGMPEQRMLNSSYDSPRVLGVWGGNLVFWATYWATYNEDRFEVFTWSGLPGEDPQYRHNDDMERRPESSHTPGIPSGVEFDGRFAFCTREGGLMVLRPSGGVDFDWRDWHRFVRPECLSVLNGKLVWKAYGQRWGFPGIWLSEWNCLSAGGDFELVGYSEGAPSSLRLAAGRVWSTSGRVNYSLLQSWNGLEGGFQEHLEPFLNWNEAVGDVPMGTYRGKLLLAARPDSFAHSGHEPMLLLPYNTAPAAPDFFVQMNGTRPGQPFTFSYADLLTLGITDAESDPISFFIGSVWEGQLKVNGTAVAYLQRLIPGDVLEWTPPVGKVGYITAFDIRASDTWDATDIHAEIRIETPHEEWTRQHFTPQQLADPLVSGPAADADGDGVSNALEFLFGRLPHQHEGERGWSFTSTTPAAGQRRAEFTFNRLAVLPQGTTILIEQSADLQSWSSVAEKFQNTAWTFPFNFPGISVEEATLPDGRIETRVAVEESSSFSRFLRLRLVLP